MAEAAVERNCCCLADNVDLNEVKGRFFFASDESDVLGVDFVGFVPGAVGPGFGDDDSEELDLPLSVDSPLSAEAIPGLLAIATPMPSATASAPTLPTYSVIAMGGVPFARPPLAGTVVR
ncbi:MAG: hypothetical protein ACRDU5_17425 [Mycobacterium sp.]